MTSALSAVLAALVQVQAPILTLEDAVARGEKKSLAIQIAQNEAVKNRDNLRAAKASSGPSLTLGGSSRRVLDGSNAFTPDWSNSLTATASIGIDISGLVRLAVRSAEYALAAQRENVEATRNTTRYDIKVAYFRLIQTDWVLQIRESTLRAAEKRANDARLKNSQGVLSKFDLTRLESDLQQARLQYDQAQLSRNLALAALNNAMREPLEQQWTLQPVQEIAEVNTSEPELKMAADRERAEIRSLKNRVSLLEVQEKVAGNSLKPSMGVQLQQSRNLNPNSFSPASQTTLGVSVSYPIFDGGVTKARVAAARRDTESLRIQLLQLREGVSLEVHVALQNLKNASAQVAITEEGLTVAREAYRLAEVRFANDLGILLDVIAAQDSLTAARARLAQANYDYLVAVAALQKAVGNDEYTIRTGSPAKKTLTTP